MQKPGTKKDLERALLYRMKDERGNTLSYSTSAGHTSESGD